MSQSFISLKLQTDKESHQKTRKKEHKGGKKYAKIKKILSWGFSNG